MSRDEEMKKYLSNCYADGGVVEPPMSDQELETENKVQDSHPGHVPEDFSNYIKGQEAQVDKYGPEQEKAVLDQILKERSSLPRNIARAGAAFTDTVAPAFGAGSGMMKNLDDEEASREKMLLESPQIQQKMNSDNMGEKQKLEGMNSATPLGASQMAPLEAFFEKVGVPKDKIPGMLQNPAAARAVVEPFATLMSNQEKIQMEALLKQIELNQRGAQLKTEASKSAADIENAKKSRKMEAVKTYGGLPWYSKLFNTDTAKAAKEQMDESGAGQTGMVKIRDSQGGVHMLPSENLEKAKQKDPGLTVVSQ